MLSIHLSSVAQRDIEEILLWTHEQFGADARLRYEQLLVQAILDLAIDPLRIGSHERPEIASGARTYHLYSSRKNVRSSKDRVRKPRHFILFRISKEDYLDVSRVLHESMDVFRHLPLDFRASED